MNHATVSTQTTSSNRGCYFVTLYFAIPRSGTSPKAWRKLCSFPPSPRTTSITTSTTQPVDTALIQSFKNDGKDNIDQIQSPTAAGRRCTTLPSKYATRPTVVGPFRKCHSSKRRRGRRLQASSCSTRQASQVTQESGTPRCTTRSNPMKKRTALDPDRKAAKSLPCGRPDKSISEEEYDLTQNMARTTTRPDRNTQHQAHRQVQFGHCQIHVFRFVNLSEQSSCDSRPTITRQSYLSLTSDKARCCLKKTTITASIKKKKRGSTFAFTKSQARPCFQTLLPTLEDLHFLCFGRSVKTAVSTKGPKQNQGVHVVVRKMPSTLQERTNVVLTSPIWEAAQKRWLDDSS